MRGIAGALLLATSAAIACGDDEDNITDPVREDFTVTLNGANERPNPVTTNATGTATLSFTGGGAVSYTVNVTNLSSMPTMAHIHGPATATETAPPIANLTVTQTQSGQLASGTVTSTIVAAISMDSLKTLLRNGRAYINVHTSNFPDGEIRGTVIAQ
jgi:hypothetical protein